MKLDRLGKCARHGPSTHESRADGPSVHAKSISPLDQRQRLSVEGKSHVAPEVASLLLTRRPSNVPGLVVPVVVRESVQRVTVRRPRSQIRQEVREPIRPRPSCAHPDASASVVPPAHAIRIGAPRLHCAPDGVFRSTLTALREAVCRAGLAQAFAPEAAAGRHAACGQMSAKHRFLRGSAFALDPPAMLLPRLRLRVPQHGQSAERLAREVTECGHRHNLTTRARKVSA